MSQKQLRSVVTSVKGGKAAFQARLTEQLINDHCETKIDYAKDR